VRSPSTSRWDLASAPENDNTAAERLAGEIRAHVEAGRVSLARAILSELLPEQRSHHALSKWVRALAPPKVRVGAPGSTPSIEENAAWLRAHGARYQGQWVALRDGVLVGHHPEQATLYEELERRRELGGVVFVCLRTG
jgi:hypothetical protein